MNPKTTYQKMRENRGCVSQGYGPRPSVGTPVYLAVWALCILAKVAINHWRGRIKQWLRKS